MKPHSACFRHGCLLRAMVAIVILCSQASVVRSVTKSVLQDGSSEADEGNFAQFGWLGAEVTGAARDKCGCGALPCKDLSGVRFSDAQIWGTRDKPTVTTKVVNWASDTAKLHIQTAMSNFTGPLRKGQMEEAFEKMEKAIYPYKPADRLIHVKVVNNKLYLIGSSKLDAEPIQGRMMSYWSKDLLRGLLKLAERGKMPDWEAIFTCAANAQDILTPFKPGIPIFTHCAPIGSGSSQGVAIPIPRPYALWSEQREPPKVQSLQEIQQTLQDKKPMAIFRGALSGPGRVPLFKLSNKQENKRYVDAGMTKVPFGAPCEKDPSSWCTGQQGPAGWVEKYDLQPGQFLTPAQQMDYRYIIVADGVGCPDRLGTHAQFNLGSSSAVLWRRSNLEEFWFPDLKPWVHYIPITDNFTNVAAMVSYYNNKLEDLSRIVANAQDYVRSYHHVGAWLEYMSSLLSMYAVEFIDYKIEVPPHAVQLVFNERKI